MDIVHPRRLPAINTVIASSSTDTNSGGLYNNSGTTTLPNTILANGNTGAWVAWMSVLLFTLLGRLIWHRQRLFGASEQA
jgi:hypothetical protein